MSKQEQIEQTIYQLLELLGEDPRLYHIKKCKG